jgi:DNA-binding response OmpR family regulator
MTTQILVVDDDVAVQKILKTMLRKKGYEVSARFNAEDGIRALELGTFNCVITEAILPEVSGFDFVREIRKHPKVAQVPVLMLTKKSTREDVARAIQAGVTEYVMKPLDPVLLFEKLDVCLEKEKKIRRVFELDLSGNPLPIEVSIEGQITKLSESGLAIDSPVPVDPSMVFRLRSSF